MALQLVLIDEHERAWRLDEHTVEVGRRGVAAARAALRAAPHHDHDGRPGTVHAQASRHAA